MAGPSPPRKSFDRSLIEGPLRPAVWRLAWPTMLQNLVAGLQGIIDHAMVGHFGGYTANAAIGVAVTVALQAGPGAFERRRWRRRSLSRRFGG